MSKQDIRQIPTWCPGCGNFAVSFALNKALDGLKIKRKDAVVCYDIGCAGNTINVLDVCGFETLHGRSIAVACGIKAVRPDLTVIAQDGDGGLLNEGFNHFVHAIQRNNPIVSVVNNNYVFGLTAGQQSSATPKGVIARGARSKNEVTPLNVVDIAVAAGAKFIARVPEGDLKMMEEVLKKALKFEGFAIVEIIQPCKIWAKSFPQIDFKKIAKPVKDRKKLIGQHDLAGLLYLEK
jgi:2-oxoglutarate ferredoxin oxidoreductase subunit beta